MEGKWVRENTHAKVKERRMLGANKDAAVHGIKAAMDRVDYTGMAEKHVNGVPHAARELVANAERMLKDYNDRLNELYARRAENEALIQDLEYASRLVTNLLEQDGALVPANPTQSTLRR
jgi:hypothetical protein